MSDSSPLNWIEEKGELVAKIQLGKHNKVKLSIGNGTYDEAPEWAAGFEQWKRDHRGETHYYTMTDIEITTKRYYTDLDEIKREVEAWWAKALVAELKSRCPSCGSFETVWDDETNAYQCYECGGVFSNKGVDTHEQN